MNNKLKYPRSIDALIEKLNYIIKNDENELRILNMQNWLDWFSKLNYTLSYDLKENEFLRAYSKDNKYSLQVWKHTEVVDSVEFDLLANHYSDYSIEITEIV